MYPLHLASYVIHELNSIPLFILESNTMLFLWFKPHSSFCLVIEWLPTRLKLWYHRILHSTNSLKYNSWGTLWISHWVHRQMPSFVETRSSGVFPLGRVRRTMEIPKKGWWLDHGDSKQRNEDINERDQPLRKGIQDREDSLGFLLPAPSPLTPPLKSRDEISCSGGELWCPDN